MKEYQKIESLYKFDAERKGFTKEFFNPIVEYLKDLQWYGTEKIDGTNIRIHWDGIKFEIAGRTDNAEVPKAIQEIFNEIFNSDMEVIFEQKFGKKDVCLFCEGYGGKIQKGAYSCETKLIGFDIMVEDTYLDKETSYKMFEEIGIEFVPVMLFKNLQEAIDYVKNVEDSIQCQGDKTEGLVCYPIKRVYDHQGNRIIVKIKRKDLAKLLD